MIDFEICPLEEKYIDSILYIENISFSDPWSRDSMEKELINEFARYVVIKKENAVIGYGGMWLILDEGHITNIAVLPEYRGMGIGKIIVQSLIDICKNENIVALTLEVRKSNEPAIKLYSKFDFIAEGIRKAYYSNNHEDAIIMWKRDLVQMKNEK